MRRTMMSRHKVRCEPALNKSVGRTLTAGALSAILVSAGLAGVAQAAPEYTEILQDDMVVVDTDSEETTGEGTNGAASLILDGDKSTYWHTKWSGGKDPLAHHVTVKLASTPINLGKIELTPRQSSSGSGRANEYEL